MIARLTGILLSKSPQSVIVDAAGVGYQAFIPLSTFYQLPDEMEKVSLHVYTHVREDTLHLFGFQTELEKKTFLLLISVSGIGPKLALNILSGIGLEDLLGARKDRCCPWGWQKDLSEDNLGVTRQGIAPIRGHRFAAPGEDRNTA